jgi:hypothetical protein
MTIVTIKQRNPATQLYHELARYRVRYRRPHGRPRGHARRVQIKRLPLGPPTNVR